MLVCRQAVQLSFKTWICVFVYSISTDRRGSNVGREIAYCDCIPLFGSVRVRCSSFISNHEATLLGLYNQFSCLSTKEARTRDVYCDILMCSEDR
jgi:hypothetical protein